jgi:F0F1-type ATP synthase epsilon subunit
MSSLTVTVVSATAEVWSGEASMVVARTTEGEIGILAGHEPTLGVLAAGEVRITTADGQFSAHSFVHRFSCPLGFSLLPPQIFHPIQN